MNKRENPFFLKALNNVISVIKSADEDKLKSVDANQLMGLLDRLLKGDDSTSLPVCSSYGVEDLPMQ